MNLIMLCALGFTLNIGQELESKSLEKYVRSLSKIPSFSTYWEPKDVYQRRGLDFDCRVKPGSIFEEYSSLARMSSEEFFTLWFGICYLIEKQTPGSINIPDGTKLQLEQSLRALKLVSQAEIYDMRYRMMTLFWLKYDVSQDNAVSPWKFYGSRAVFAPDDRYFPSAESGYVHIIKVPSLEELLKLPLRKLD